MSLAFYKDTNEPNNNQNYRDLPNTLIAYNNQFNVWHKPDPSGNVFWFTIYGPQTVAGASIGPTGPVGPVGPVWNRRGKR